MKGARGGVGSVGSAWRRCPHGCRSRCHCLHEQARHHSACVRKRSWYPFQRHVRRTLGDRAITETSDAAGIDEWDSLTLLRASAALVSMHRAAIQALRNDPRACRFSGVFVASLHCPGKASGWYKIAMCAGMPVSNPHQVSKMSSLWSIEQSSVREFGKLDS